MTSQVILSLGSNIEPRDFYLDKALQDIESGVGKVKKYSSIIETPSWGYRDAHYLNQCVWIETELTPPAVLRQALAIESDLGRVRTRQGYMSRTVDIDLILFDDLVINFRPNEKDEQLSVPHPLFHLRDFVLKPLVEICPDWIHPYYGTSVLELYKNL